MWHPLCDQELLNQGGEHDRGGSVGVPGIRCMTSSSLEESARRGCGMVTPLRPAACALAAITCISLASRRKSNSLGTVSRISSRSCAPAHRAQLYMTAQLVSCKSHRRDDDDTLEACGLCSGRHARRRLDSLGTVSRISSRSCTPAQPHLSDLAARAMQEPQKG